MSSITIGPVLDRRPASGVAALPGGGWVASDRSSITIYRGPGLEPDLVSVPASVPSLHGLRLSADRSVVLAAPERYDLGEDRWETLPTPGPFLDGLAERPSGEYEIDQASWDAAGTTVAVFARFRASRKRGAAGRGGAPAARILLLEGRSRHVEHVLADLDHSVASGPMVVEPGFVACAAPRLLAWSRADGSRSAELAWTSVLVTGAAMVGSRVLAATDIDGRVVTADVARWTTGPGWQAHDGEATALAVRGAGDELATGGADGFVRRWSPDGRQITEVHVGAAVEAVAYAADGGRLLVASGGVAPVITECRLED